MEPAVARRMWLVGEPIHALTYFAQGSFDGWEAAGLRGFWRGYFATRAAPFGPVGPGLVTATFFNFHPTMVERALPSVWGLASPADALAARLDGMDRALRAVLGDDVVDITPLAGTIDALRRGVDACPVAGRALFAANASLPWPEPAHLALWHGLTCLREHRGDGHNAALVAAGIDGCQAHVLAGAAGGAPQAVTQPARGWSDEEWAAATEALVARGVVDPEGGLTTDGRALHGTIQARTDELALAPWAHLGEEATQDVAAVLEPWARRIQAAGVIRHPNPMSLPPLPDTTA
ncbi:MAG: hypothetical protein Q8K58_07330 [Acidimicrobiales bacterium]|nr:hypothetical protein [Acidimicrobiales bacterium]